METATSWNCLRFPRTCFCLQPGWEKKGHVHFPETSEQHSLFNTFENGFRCRQQQSEKPRKKKTAKTNSRLAISQISRLAWSIIIEGFREFSGNIYSPSLQSNVTVCPLLRWWEPTALTLRPEEPCAMETTPGSQKNLQTAASMAAPAWQPRVPTPIPPFHGFSPRKRGVFCLFLMESEHMQKKLTHSFY